MARYLGSLPFYLHQHLNDQSLEINAVDAAVLEVLRMYEPAVFERLAGRPIITERNVMIWLAIDYEKSKQESVIAEIVSLVPEGDRERLKGFLNALFPLLDPKSPGSDTTLDSCLPLAFQSLRVLLDGIMQGSIGLALTKRRGNA